ncbi:MAG: aminoglycoside phosphotransferase family protein [Clostridia bacterium]|jgi:hypothetical protein|nr:aminoglycoside phosphotransferase family protein [Clostridia bacterium]NLV34279.1 aminoglycoside phosphotransferase family protein [Clostridiaceae bacterium]
MNNEINIANKFCYDGYIVSIKPIGAGHINKTYLVETTKEKYTLQLINTSIFKDPEGLMQNIFNVTEFLKEKIKSRGGDIKRETLSVVKTKDGCLFYKDKENFYWRSYIYIDDVTTYQEPKNLIVTHDSGYAFGDFINMLSDYDMSTLNETIKDFHNTVKRFNDFEDSVKNDIAHRTSNVSNEIDFLYKRFDDCNIILDSIKNGSIPLRVTHNDTKLNNLLFDNTTDKPICILDLDTVMPGSLLYDYGDALRISGSSAAEDEEDLNKVHFIMDNFVSFTKGFLSATKDSINEMELSLLPFSIKLITMEIGMRFLTDYLNNDIYFSIHKKDHNLFRARTQFKLVAEIENNLDEMKRIVERLGRES